MEKWNILLVEEEQSAYDVSSSSFDTLFASVERTTNKDAVIPKLYDAEYDMLILDTSRNMIDALALMKKIKDAKIKIVIFALVLPKDNQTLYGIADLGFNAFEISEEQFEPALEEIAKFNPHA